MMTDEEIKLVLKSALKIKSIAQGDQKKLSLCLAILIQTLADSISYAELEKLLESDLYKKFKGD